MGQDPTGDILTMLARLDERMGKLHDPLVEQRTIKDRYTTAELAKLVGRDEFTVREWCRRGRVEAAKKGSGRGKHRGWAVSREELLRYQRDGLLPQRRP